MRKFFIMSQKSKHGHKTGLTGNTSRVDGYCEIRRRAAALGIHTVGRRLTSTPTLPIRPRVVVNLTYACNLACAGCSHACFHKPPRIPAMSVKKFGETLDDLCHSKMPLTALCLMGGEPTLHPRFTEIVDMAADAGKSRGFL
jgi:pyruvate-formate lyase-activating enzyme